MVTISQDELNQEIELKLQFLDVTTETSLWETPYVKHGLITPPEEKELLSIYYDTKDHRLLKQGYTLRVRNDKENFTLTIKKTGDVAGGLHQRAEWNYPSPSGQPSLDVIEDHELRERLSSILEDKSLVELLVTAFRRTQSTWQDVDGNLLELALDTGHIETEKGKKIIREVELELIKGQTTALLSMGEQLSMAYPMIPGNESKFYRGLQLLNLHNERGTVSETNDNKQPPLKDNNLGKVIPRLLEEAFYIVLDHFHQLSQDGISEEEVHKIRVSSRHVRSLLFFFKPALTKDSYKPLAKSFKSLARNFGKLREVQVMNYHLQQSPCVGSCELLESIISGEVSKELQALERHIMAGTLTPLVLRLWRMVMMLQVKEACKEKPVSHFAEERLDAWLVKYKQGHLKLSPLDIDQLHQQRIRVKRIRYASEWLRPLLAKKVAKAVKTLKEQQELMGELHDIHGERIKLRKWINRSGSSTALMYQLGIYEGWQELRKHKLWESLLH